MDIWADIKKEFYTQERYKWEFKLAFKKLNCLAMKPSKSDFSTKQCASVIMSFYIATDKGGIRQISFLFLHGNICCGYSLEALQRGASNDYPQHMFSCRNKKNIHTFWLQKCLILGNEFHHVKKGLWTLWGQWRFRLCRMLTHTVWLSPLLLQQLVDMFYSIHDSASQKPCDLNAQTCRMI